MRSGRSQVRRSTAVNCMPSTKSSTVSATSTPRRDDAVLATFSIASAIRLPMSCRCRGDRGDLGDSSCPWWTWRASSARRSRFHAARCPLQPIGWRRRDVAEALSEDGCASTVAVVVPSPRCRVLDATSFSIWRPCSRRGPSARSLGDRDAVLVIVGLPNFLSIRRCGLRASVASRPPP